MRIPAPKSLLFILCFFFFSIRMTAHGFSYHTGILADSGRCIALGAIKKEFKWITSYNFASQSTDFSVVHAAGLSQTNCYFRLQLDNDEPACNNEILCTPTQLFYISSKKTWVPALDLQVGDELLGMHNTIERIAYLEFVNKPLEVHTIEVKKHHNFFVGCRHHAVLTHNMLAPVGIWTGLSVAFGQGAAVGGGTGSFFGPVTVVGGIVIGGLVGVVVHSLWQPKFKYSLAFNAPGICEYKLKSNDAVYVGADTCYFKPRENAAGAMTASITENSDGSYFSNRFSSAGQQKLVKKTDYNVGFKAGVAGRLTRANKTQGAQVGISSPPLPNPPEDDDDKDKEYFNNQQKIKISRDDIPHIFENRPGHLPDSLENRQLLVDLVLDENNFIGLDKYGTKWYSQITTQGKQLWAVVRNGLIRNGGINNIPRAFNGKTGLSRLLEL